MPSAEYREEELPGLCAGDPRLSWMPMEAFETLGACFHLCAQALAAGETVETAGRIGYLLRGSGVVDGTVRPSGTLFGVKREEYGRKISAPASLVAREPSIVLWMDFDAVRSVCYGACWFHVRLLREMDALLG